MMRIFVVGRTGRKKIITIKFEKKEESESDTENKVEFKIQSEIGKHKYNIQEILLNSNATPIRSKIGTGYTCCFCSNHYPDPKDLKHHTLNDHDDETKSKFMKGTHMHSYFVKLDITDLKCKCGKSYETTEALTEHLNDAHKVKIYTQIKSHILPFKFTSQALTCCICFNIFNTFKALQEHMNVHYRNFICEVCDAGFVNKNILLRHQDAHKTGTYSCEECKRTFDTARKKQLHDRSKHPGVNLPHKCAYCNERFNEVWKKLLHMTRVHDIKIPEIKCQACDKSFISKYLWRLHISRVHLMHKPFKCTNCEMQFYGKKELASHMIKHTGTRDFQCDVCLKCYARQKTLKEHKKRMHS
ncbi:unnamed protein product [Colias eurytheme]|nr:unnamed protein product [Colias eurytheme]